MISRPLHICILAGLFAAAVCSPARAVEDEVAAKARAAKGVAAPTKGSEMLYGPVLMDSIQVNAKQPVAAKGLVIQLGEKGEASVCFDTDTLRMAAFWTGGFLDLNHTNIGTYKGDGTGAADIAGELQWRTADGPGWSLDPTFTDPRPEKAGPLPRERGHFKGFYLHGNRVILSYTVEGCDVLESVTFVKVGDRGILMRYFSFSPAVKDLKLRLADAPDGKFATKKAQLFTMYFQGNVRGIASVPSANGTMILHIPAHAEATNLAVALSGNPRIEPPEMPDISSGLQNLAAFCKGSASRWPQTIEVKGTAAKDDAAYVVETIPLPVENPWKSWMRVSAFDFFSDGRAAVATLNGDVWIVSGLDAKLEKVTWKRFAVGLYEPLGLKIVKDEIYVHGRDQITRLHDLNGDGEADFYENFNSDRTLWPSYHAFAFDLQTDSHGNFYYVVGGNQLGTKRDWHASLFRVSPDGAKTDVVATGFRAPNGMGIGPHDEIVVSDNQGHWIPSSKINLVKPGGFYGHVADPRIDAKAPAPATFDPPLCYIPVTLDNSTGGQVWVTGGKWGPFEGHLLSTSYGKSALLAVLDEKVDGIAQGGAFVFPLKFESEIMRARFNPKDGQLYVSGLRGWQTTGAKDGCFQRVRYTGQPVKLPTELHVGKDAITLGFPTALDPVYANDAANFSIEQYNYQWWSTYGSPDLSLANPGKKGRDPVEITAAKLSPDGKSVTLTVPGLQPVMQMEIKLRLRTASGAEIDTTIGNTIHKIPAPPTDSGK